MANPSPLHERFDEADAQLMPLGGDGAIAALHDVLEVEYAALRKAVVAVDCPNRALATLTGGDRIDFLHRLLTNDIAGLQPGAVTRAFLLTAKGRIIADAHVVHTIDATHLDTDVFGVAALLEQLNELLFGEDVQIDDRRQSWHRLSLHGPNVQALLDAGAARSVDPIEPGRFGEVTVGTIGAYAYRDDDCGVPGVHLWLPTAHAAPMWTALMETGQTLGLRAAGWMAYNTARIEAGSPLFMVDFDTNALPGETALLDQAVSFTKGCYRGQEIVARLRDVGHPARTLVRFAADDDTLPTATAPVFDQPNGQQVGAITSSTIAPMRGGRAIGLAMVKWDHREAGELFTPAEGSTIPINIEPLEEGQR